MKKTFTHFKKLTFYYGIGKSRAEKIYNILGLNTYLYPLKIKKTKRLLLVRLFKFILLNRNLRFFIQKAKDFLKKLKNFKSKKKNNSKFFITTQSKRFNEKKK
jgi:hypothetical protein